MSEALLRAMRDLIQADPGGRGLASVPGDNLLTACADDFAAACRSLASAPAPALAVVTGFYIAHATPPCGETDGPLGAVFLARALVPLGVKVVLASDAFCLPALEAGVNACGLRKAVPLVCLPGVAAAAAQSAAEYVQEFRERAGPLTHLIALERVGPSHTAASVRAQAGEAAAADFLERVPPEGHDRCHSMRGRDITLNTSPAHRLFEAAAWTTAGIGDGGNEIGMGKVPWDVVRRNVPRGERIACRVPADHCVVCGVSNWGAYALAAGVRLLRGAPREDGLFDVGRERELLERMVERGPLVDGATGRPEASVDGLPFERYAEVLRRLGEIVAGAG
jgi:hypothetical protein